MTLPEWALNLLLTRKIIHQSPGRLRLYYPVLANAAPAVRRQVSGVIDQINLPAGINSIQLNSVSASVLVLYEADRHGQADVLAWLDGLTALLSQSVIRLSRLPQSKRAMAQKKLIGFLRRINEEKVLMKKRIVVPEHVWT